ncbi:MAG: hypothetical protein PVG14_15755 [Anaerolineales bacterium]|jgi:hypothetical protein
MKSLDNYWKRNHKYLYIIGLSFIVFSIPFCMQPQAMGEVSEIDSQEKINTNIVESDFYLPIAQNKFPLMSPFGSETIYSAKLLPGSELLTHALSLGMTWQRMNGRISWRLLQPDQGGMIDWSSMKDFEEELRTLRMNGISPIVIVDDYPYWATVEPTSCAAIKTEYFEEFADFMRQLVERYHVPEFNVKNWELGNEVDVDPSLVRINSAFGCWGDIDDPYYGGEHYGEFLKLVSPIIKSVDPDAQVWIGGLLLDSPNTTKPNRGKPELFLQGVLEAGAAPYFDVVPYHVYIPYFDTKIDHDLLFWGDWGGGVLGKARYIREMMAEYGIVKPVFLNEAGLMCPPKVGGEPIDYCDPPSADFFEMQANHIVRQFVRGLSENVMGYVWYTLNGPGWRNTGLLDENGDPRPVYYAYQNLINLLEDAPFDRVVDYGLGIEAYIFAGRLGEIHTIWSIEDQAHTITVPQDRFIAAYDREGNAITPISNGDNFEFRIQFEPSFIVRLP